MLSKHNGCKGLGYSKSGMLTNLKKLIIFISLTGFSMAIFGQNPATTEESPAENASSSANIPLEENSYKNEIGLSWMPGFLAHQDLIASPMITDGFSALDFNLYFRRRTDFQHEANLRYGKYRPPPLEDYEFTIKEVGKVATEPHIFDFYSIHYSLGYLIPIKANWKLYTGGIINMDYLNSTYVTGWSGVTTYIGTLGLGSQTTLVYPIANRFVLEGSLRLPLLSLVARSPYLANDDEYLMGLNPRSDIRTLINRFKAGHWESWGKYQAIHAKFLVRYSYTKRITFMGGYQFSFQAHHDPLTLLSYLHSLNFSVGVGL